ncbi:MAG: DPP IV N-terminal domain-containing protein [Planctomycetota bacterium]
MKTMRKMIISVIILLIFGCQSTKKNYNPVVEKNDAHPLLEPITTSGLYHDLREHTNFSYAKFNSFVISEDETLIVFSAKIDSEYFHLYQKHPYGKSFTQITTGKSNNLWPSISYDKKKVAFISDRDGSPNVYIVELDKTFLIAQITDDRTEKFLPKFSPDGTQILYTVKENEKFTMIVIDLNTKIKTFLGEGIGFSWAQNNRILFMKPKETQTNAIWTIEPAKLNVSQVVSDHQKFIVFPSSNSAGEIFCYSKTRQPLKFETFFKGTFPSVSELWISIINERKRAEYQIMNDGYTNFNPIISGERLYFISDRNNGENLWSVKIALDIKKNP